MRSIAEKLEVDNVEAMRKSDLVTAIVEKGGASVPQTSNADENAKPVRKRARVEKDKKPSLFEDQSSNESDDMDFPVAKKEKASASAVTEKREPREPKEKGEGRNQGGDRPERPQPRNPRNTRDREPRNF